MKKSLVLIGLFMLFVFAASAQEEEAPGLSIYGSVDTYYKYDFSGTSQINTSFASAQHSIGIGMVDLVVAQSLGKASFVGEVAFGPRANASAPGAVQNLYVAYEISDLITITGGFMATYIGYEVISPVANYNYSTSYLFSNGPFQNGGVKVDFNVSDRFGFMLGVFNEFDSYINTKKGLDLGAQIYFVPVSGWDLYLNFVTSDDSGTEVDITTTYAPDDNWLIGFNAARRTRGNYFVEKEGDGINFTGAALYLNYNFSDIWGIGFRGEHFIDTNGEVFGTGMESSVNAFTLSANIGSGPLKLIPEIRTDIASEDIFVDGKENAINMAAQFLVAAVYAF